MTKMKKKNRIVIILKLEIFKLDRFFEIFIMKN